MVIDPPRISHHQHFNISFNYKLAITTDIIAQIPEIGSLASSTAGSVSVSETSQNTGNIHDGTHIFPCVSGALV